MSTADLKKCFGLKEAGVYYAFLLMLFVLSVATHLTGGPAYLSTTNLTDILYQGSMIGMMAVAMTVILITGNFDLSVASVAALAATITVGLAGTLGFWLAGLCAIVAACAVGVLNGAIVQFVGVNAFIVTLGTLTAIRGLVLVITNGRSLMILNPSAQAQMALLAAGKIPVHIPIMVIGVALLSLGVWRFLKLRTKNQALPVNVFGTLVGGGLILLCGLVAGRHLMVEKPVIYTAIYTFIIWFVLNFTIIGRRLYATGGNPVAARLSGVNVTLYKMSAFILSSGTAGFAGVLFAARLGAVNPTALQGAELTVIAAAILGGTSLFGGAGSVIKTLIGALILFTLDNGFNVLNLGANYQGLIEGSVIVVAAVIYTVGGTKRDKTS